MYYGVVGFLVGAVIIGGAVYMNNRPCGMMDGGSMQTTMHGMMSTISNKTGDEFDEAFLSEMIVHHEGAIAMAEAALKNANHQEIKDMAKAIISAQSAEISQMKEWQKNWYSKAN